MVPQSLNSWEVVVVVVVSYGEFGDMYECSSLGNSQLIWNRKYLYKENVTLIRMEALLQKKDN